MSTCASGILKMAPSKPKTGHVNMMADTVIANLPLEGLRVVLRGMLANQPDCTATFEDQARQLMRATPLPNDQSIKTTQDASSFLEQVSKRVCCMIGCGLCYEALPVLQNTIEAISRLPSLIEESAIEQKSLSDQVIRLDGMIVQTITAIQKTLLSSTGARNLSENERKLIEGLLDGLAESKTAYEKQSQTFLLDRGLEAVVDFLHPGSNSLGQTPATTTSPMEAPVVSESFTVNGINLPRIFTGLWQLSSPAWGSAPQSKIMEQFSQYVENGLTAFDMADHYGDAEIIFVSIIDSLGYSN